MKSLMLALARIGDDLNRPPEDAPTSMLVCFSGVTADPQGGMQRPAPESELRFWMELKK